MTLGAAAVAPSMLEPAGYVREPLRKAQDFTFFRGPQPGNPLPVLASALAAEQPSPQILRCLQLYLLGAEIDPAWPVKPLTLTGNARRPILVHKDPGGQPLDRVLEREKERPLDLTRLLHIARPNDSTRSNASAPPEIIAGTLAYMAPDRPDDSLD